jgi:hypothetical protein
MQTAPPPDRCDAWAVQIARLPGHNKVAIALANKLARIVWVVWRHGTDYVGTLRANFADYPVHERVLARQGCVEGKARPGAAAAAVVPIREVDGLRHRYIRRAS